MIKTITVTLTDVQYRALGSAADYYGIVLQDMDDKNSSRSAKALTRGWEAIRDAWKVGK